MDGDTAFSKMARCMVQSLKKDPARYESIRKNMNGDKCFEDLFAIIWDLQESRDFITPNLILSQKGEQQSICYRLEGNSFYKQANLERALELYNLSIILAPHPVIDETPLPSYNQVIDDNAFTPPRIASYRYGGFFCGESTALAFGYANRSAVFISLGLYEQCLRDIDFAFKYGYPEEHRSILEKRKTKCLRALQFKTEATKQASESQTPDASGSSEVPKADVTSSLKHLKKNPRKDIEDLLSVTLDLSVRSYETQSLKQTIRNRPLAPPKIQDPIPDLPVLSSAVEISYSPGKGRGLVATRNIRPGEVIGVEKAFCVSIDKDKLPFYCGYCMHVTLNPLPCPGCTLVVFCSEECRSKALTEDHWLECSILTTLNALGLDNRNLAVKLIKTLTYSRLMDFLDELEKTHEERGASGHYESSGYSSSSYQNIHRLCTNKRKQSFEYIFVQCAQAYVLTNLILQSGKHFVNVRGVPFHPSREEAISTGSEILANIMKIRSNVFEIFDKKDKKPIGAGVFPILSLVNHSCNPVTKEYSCGRNLVLRAVRPISKGDEITVSYVGDFNEESYEERAADLFMYSINCECDACDGGWPLYEQLPVVNLKWSSKKKKKEISDKIWSAVIRSCQIGVKLGSGDPISQGEYQFLVESIELMYENVTIPCQNISNMQSLLLKCFLHGK